MIALAFTLFMTLSLFNFLIPIPTVRASSYAGHAENWPLEDPVANFGCKTRFWFENNSDSEYYCSVPAFVSAVGSECINPGYYRPLNLTIRIKGYLPGGQPINPGKFRVIAGPSVSGTGPEGATDAALQDLALDVLAEVEPVEELFKWWKYVLPFLEGSEESGEKCEDMSTIVSWSAIDGSAQPRDRGMSVCFGLDLTGWSPPIKGMYKIVITYSSEIYNYQDFGWPVKSFEWEDVFYYNYGGGGHGPYFTDVYNDTNIEDNEVISSFFTTTEYWYDQDYSHDVEDPLFVGGVITSCHDKGFPEKINITVTAKDPNGDPVNTSNLEILVLPRISEPEKEGIGALRSYAIDIARNYALMLFDALFLPEGIIALPISAAISYLISPRECVKTDNNTESNLVSMIWQGVPGIERWYERGMTFAFRIRCDPEKQGNYTISINYQASNLIYPYLNHPEEHHEFNFTDVINYWYNDTPADPPLSAPPLPQKGLGWLKGWNYRKSHEIHNASGAGTNYQVKVKVHYGSGEDSGSDVYCNEHCRTDFEDIRFTARNGLDQLDYWMEERMDSNYSVFWVEVSDDLSDNTTAIYMYYGNKYAATTSNGTSTFIFFDDYNDDSIDSDKWDYQLDNSNGSNVHIAEQNQAMESWKEAGDGVSGTNYRKSDDSWSVARTVEFKLYIDYDKTSTGGYDHDWKAWYLDDNNWLGIGWASYSSDQFRMRVQKMESGSPTYGNWKYLSWDSWYYIRLRVNSTTVELEVYSNGLDDTLLFTDDLSHTRSGNGCVYNGIASSAIITDGFRYLDDDFRIRKYTYLEPSHGDWEGEEICGPSWLEGWNYRKTHFINNVSSAGANYQVNIKVHYGGGADSGSHLYCYYKCKNDFGDIRFTDYDGRTELDYWIEEKVDGHYASFWVEVADNLNYRVRAIYVYYGKSDAITTSNGTNTFILVDDGVDYNLENNVAGSSVYDHSSGQITITDGDSTDDGWIIGGDLDGIAAFLASVDTIDDASGSSSTDCTYAVFGLHDFADFPSPMTDTVWNPTFRFGVNRRGHDYSTYGGRLYITYKDTSDVEHYYTTGGTWTTTFSASTCYFGNKNEEYKVEVWDDGTCFKAQILDAEGVSILPSGSPATIAKSSVKAFTDGRVLVTAEPYTSHYYANTKFDSYYVRKYIDTDVSHGSWGYEEACLWLTGWKYRKSHAIDPASGAGTNYQVKTKVHYGFGEDSGADVYCTNRCKSDFGDIRFTEDDGKTELNYWMEEKTDFDNATFWVKVPDDLSSSGTKIYIYYGRSDMSTTSNGENTFLFFDDFSGNSLDTEKWVEDEYGTGSVSVSGGLLTIDEYGGGTGNVRTIHSNTYQVPTGVAIHTRFGEETLYDSSYGQTSPIIGEIDAFPFHATTTNAQFMMCSDGTGRTIKHQSKTAGGGWGGEDTIYGTTPTLSTFYRAVWYKLSSSQSYYFLDDSGNQLGSLTDNSDPPQGATTYSLTLGARGMKTSWDWVFARKYIANEPSNGSWGAEEKRTTPDLGWLKGWFYRKNHTICSAEGAGYHYQIRMNVHFGSGTDSGEDVYCYGKCQPDFDDVRFTSADGETELPYWMEEKVNSDYATFWIKVADNLSASDATIYIYYGSGASTTSNGDATFIFFDDFESNNLYDWDYIGDWEVKDDHPEQETHAAYIAGGQSNRELAKDIALYGNFMVHVWASAATESEFIGYPHRPLDDGGQDVDSMAFYDGYIRYHQGEQYYYVTIRPNDAGDHTELTPSPSGSNWQCVDEVSCDFDSTYVWTSSSGKDTYHLQNPDPEKNTGSLQVWVYYVVRKTSESATANSASVLRVGGVTHVRTPAPIQSTSYYVKSAVWSTNPTTGELWTWDDINSLQAGVYLETDSGSARCTQIWVEVHFLAEYKNWPQNSAYSANDYHRLEVGYDLDNSKQGGWINGTYMGQIDLKDAANGGVNHIEKIRFFGGNDYGQDMWIDAVYIRKWIPNEPSHGAWGSEEFWGTSDAVDDNTSNVDGLDDIGSETGFENAKGTYLDDLFMQISEDYTLDGYHYVTLAPNGPGHTALSKSGAPTNWQACQTEGGGYVYRQPLYSAYDTYTAEDTSDPGSIEWVRVYLRVRQDSGDGPNGKCREQLVTHGNLYEGSDKFITSTGWYYTYAQWTNNPYTGEPWTWDEINDMKIGVELTRTYIYRLDLWGKKPYCDRVYAYVKVSGSYQIDLEYQWTDVIHNDTTEELWIYVAEFGGENILAQYWNGSEWFDLGTITQTGWFICSATGLDSSTYTIRLVGTNENEDGSQDTYKIDAMLLRTFNW